MNFITAIFMLPLDRITQYYINKSFKDNDNKTADTRDY